MKRQLLGKPARHKRISQNTGKNPDFQNDIYTSHRPIPSIYCAAVAIANANTPAMAARAASTGNSFSGYQLYANSFYASEVTTSALPSMTGTAAAAASKVAEVPSFYWL